MISFKENEFLMTVKAHGPYIKKEKKIFCYPMYQVVAIFSMSILKIEY